MKDPLDRRAILARVDIDLFLRVQHLSKLTRKPVNALVDRGLRMVLNEATREWPAEWLVPVKASGGKERSR